MSDAISRTIWVACPPERAFTVFGAEMARWWPADRFSRAAGGEFGPGVKVERVVFEARAGGRVYEVTSDAREASWGEVLVFEPPHRIVLAWHPSAVDRPPTEVEVSFTPEDGGTRVRLEHRGWERLGDIADALRSDYRNGWPLVFDQCYAAAI